MKAREVVLLVVIIAAGVLLYYGQTGKAGFHLNFGDGPIMGDRGYSYTESLTVDAPIPARLKVINAHGSVEVQGADREGITITFEKTVRRRSEKEAKEVADALKAVIVKNAGEILLTTNRDEFPRKNFETSFRLTIPLHMDVSVDNPYGDVKAGRIKNLRIDTPHGRILASDIEGEAVLANSYEDLEVRNVEAGCRIDASHGEVRIYDVRGEVNVECPYGSVEAEGVGLGFTVVGPHSEIIGRRIQGAADIQNSYEDITLRDAAAVTIRGQHSGVDLEKIRGDVQIMNSYGRVIIAGLSGRLFIEGKSLEVSGKSLTSPEIRISSSYEDVGLVDFSGPATVTLSHGACSLQPRSLMNSPIDVRSEYGEIRLLWPSGESVTLEARSKGGNIEWKLPGSPALRKENGETVVKAFPGAAGEPAVYLSTSYADIYLEERTAESRGE